jgi:hypothetical protein
MSLTAAQDMAMYTIGRRQRMRIVDVTGGGVANEGETATEDEIENGVAQSERAVPVTIETEDGE